MDKKRTAVLIHGCHLEANRNGQTYDDVLFGYRDGKPSLYGRLPMGLTVAREFDAEAIIFGTGSSTKDGVIEAQQALNRALTVEDNDWLLERAVLDVVSQNTAEECTNNIRYCIEKGIERIILVSSPWHIERCHLEALKASEHLRGEGLLPPDILTTACYGDTEGVVVLEPPHRGDRARTRWHELAQAFFKIPEEKREEFENAFEIIVDKYTQSQ